MIERITRVPFRLGQDKGIAGQQTLVAAAIESKFNALNLTGAIRRDPIVHELSNAAAQAWCQATGRHHGDMDHVLVGQRRLIIRFTHVDSLCVTVVVVVARRRRIFYLFTRIWLLVVVGGSLEKPHEKKNSFVKK